MTEVLLLKKECSMLLRQQKKLEFYRRGITHVRIQMLSIGAWRNYLHWKNTNRLSLLLFIQRKNMLFFLVMVLKNNCMWSWHKRWRSLWSPLNQPYSVIYSLLFRISHELNVHRNQSFLLKETFIIDKRWKDQMKSSNEDIPIKFTRD